MQPYSGMEMGSLDELLIGSNGHCISYKYSDKLLDILEWIVTSDNKMNGRLSLKELNKQDQAEYSDLFDFFYQTGALVPTEIVC